ncbi:TPA: hypothetical protein NKU37_002930 [Vibrio parahaemolyticus]|nr:hypothetical protein [Vibrio parahaemolyticus]
MRILYFNILFIFSSYSFALQPGQCSFPGTTLTYSGSDITTGPLSGGSERFLGYLDLSMPYTCHTYTTVTDGYTIQWGLSNSSNSHISGNRFQSNIEGIELRLVDSGSDQTLELSGIAGQPGSGIVITRWVPSNVDVDTEHSDPWSSRMFAVYQTGTISTMSTKIRLGLSNDYNVIVFKGANTSEGVYQTGAVFPKSQELQLLDSTCKLNYQPTQNIGNLIQGREKSVDFNINLICSHATSIQNNFQWTFTVNGANVSITPDRASAIYSGSGLPSVVMNLDSRRNDGHSGSLIFGDSYLFLNPGNANSFDYPLRATFSSRNNSNVGDFSFKLNFQLNYN